jgi:hypothetical protein
MPTALHESVSEIPSIQQLKVAISGLTFQEINRVRAREHATDSCNRHEHEMRQRRISYCR